MGDFEVTMEGGRPWGIRMQGGKGTGAPLKVASVTPGSKASGQGVEAELHILAINGMDTSNLTMVEAQNIVKETGNKLILRLKKAGGGEEDDFFADLKKSMAGDDDDSGKGAVKGNTFKMLQGHMDAGQTASVLTVWDKPVGERNKSIPTNAPKVQPVDQNYDKSSFGLADDRDSRQTAFLVTMTGGKPWGIRLQGGMGSGTPLCIAHVTPESKAHTKRLLVGDEITAINDTSTKNLTMEDAQNLIKGTGDKLKLSVIKHGLKNAEQCGPTASEMETRVREEDDPEFYKSLQESVKGGREDWSGRQVKGSAFKKLQNIVDSGNV